MFGRNKSLKQNKRILKATSVLLALAALLHLARLIFRWEVTIDDWLMPLWINAVLFPIAGFLSYKLCKMAGKK